MCGRYVMGLSQEEFQKQFTEYQVASELPIPSWNIKPTQQIAVLLEDHKQQGFLRAESARWSLTPVWSKTLETRTPLFNARVETVLEKPSFKASAKSRRCLIPAEGYFEWTGPKGDRTPHFIHLSGELILFAGIHSWWHDPSAPEGEGWHLTATMLTMDSYGPMQPIHNRIPVLMSADLQAEWLSPSVEGVPELYEAAVAASRGVGERLIEHAVAPLRGDGPELLAAV